MIVIAFLLTNAIINNESNKTGVSKSSQGNGIRKAYFGANCFNLSIEFS